MAERRMFAKSIVLSDAFLDMPMSARCLYFTLGMLADDDGFVGSPKSIMRQCGASDDDMNILLAKRYVLGFDSGIIVIKHWRMNNYLQNDRKKITTYLEELDTLTIDEKGAYTEKNKQCIQNVYKLDTQVSIGKNSIDKNSDDDYKYIFADELELLDSRYLESGVDRKTLAQAQAYYVKYNIKSTDFYKKIIDTLTDTEIFNKEAYISEIARNEI